MSNQENIEIERQPSTLDQHQSLCSPVLPPSKQLRGQISSPSAIIDSPRDDTMIQQPQHSFSAVNSFQVSMTRKALAMNKSNENCNNNPNNNPEQQIHASRNHHPQSLPFKLSSSKGVGLSIGSNGSSAGMVNHLQNLIKQPSPNYVGSSMAKNHSHYFQNSAVSLSSYMQTVAAPTFDTHKPKTEQPVGKHKVSQSSHIQSDRQHMPLIKTPKESSVDVSSNSGVSQSLHRRFQPLGSWQVPENLTLSKNPSSEHFHSTQSLGICQAKNSTDRQIPVQKVRIARKVPHTSSKNASNTTASANMESLLQSQQHETLFNQRVGCVLEKALAGSSSAETRKPIIRNTRTERALSKNPSVKHIDLAKREIDTYEEQPLSPGQKRLLCKVGSQSIPYGHAKITTNQQPQLLALSARSKNGHQKSTKILRKHHVNFEKNPSQNHLLQLQTPSTASTVQQPYTGTNAKLNSGASSVRKHRLYGFESRVLQKSHSPKVKAIEPDESKNTSTSKKDNKLNPIAFKDDENQVASKTSTSKRTSLEIQIPQSPLPVVDGDEINSAAAGAVGQRKQIATIESKHTNGQAQVLKTVPVQGTTGLRGLTRQNQHQSPLLEQMKASQSAITTNNTAIVGNLPASERPLQVFRPNCLSTRNLPSSSAGKLQGCVPSTAAVVDENSTQNKQQAEVAQATRPSNNNLPPAPASSKHYQHSRSQSGAREPTLASQNAIQTTANASSPLAQYANYAFQPACKILLPPKLTYEASKTSVRRNGVVRGYAANTHQGLVRNYNEDRVSIILNISEPHSRKKMSPTSGENSPWPVCSFFGIYDGHGGSQCADFLRDNLHTYVVREPCFPDDPREALKIGFAKAEKRWIQDHAIRKAEDGSISLADRSGSCAIVVLIIEEMCYVANVGDSRAVLSGDGGTRTYSLSRDHKPGDEYEKQRILEAGGKIYSRSIPASTKNQLPPGNKASTDTGSQQQQQQPQCFVGPERIFPGRLSVSRSFGDVEAKLPELGGNPKVLITTPEIKAFRIKKEYDFIALGCDGIFDRINNKEAVQVIWNCTKDMDKLYPDIKNVHQLAGLGVDYLVKNSLLRRSLDNVTAVIVAFRNFKHTVFGDDGNDLPTAGQHRPNTTKAVPQVGAMKIIGKANGESRHENSAKPDARSNSLALKQPQTCSTVGQAKVATKVNSCQQLAKVPSNLKLQAVATSLLSQAVSPRTDSQYLSTEGINNRIDKMSQNKGRPPSSSHVNPHKTLTRQDKTGPAPTQAQPSHQLKSTPSMTMSQNVLQQTSLLNTTGQQGSASTRNFRLRRTTSNTNTATPTDNSTVQQRLTTTLRAQTKIPQLVSRDSLNTKLSARKLLHKSGSSGGVSDASGYSGTHMVPSTTQGASMQIATGATKQSKPRFFKFDNCDDKDDEEGQPHTEPSNVKEQ